MEALSSSADILVGGGAAGVGKTFSLLLEPIRHKDVKDFGAVCFRRTTPMIRTEGGLWDSSQKLYRKVHGARAREQQLEWRFPSGAKIKFSHLEHESNKFDWQGSEIPLIMFDELTHFSKSMFLYLLSRNRSTCGVKPYIRATCNPDPDSWVSDMVSWYIDQDATSPNYGYPIEERRGVIRYFASENDNFVWGNSVDEVYQKCRDFIDLQIELSKGMVQVRDFVKSFTFIGGTIWDNKELLRKNPGYLGNLNALPEDEKNRLLGGNWKVSLKGNDIYNYYKFLDIFTNSFVPHGEKRITTDIALKGSDRFVIFVWSGKRLIDFHIMHKSNGKEVIDKIREYAFAHDVPHSNILFDNDGVGQFVDGFIENAKEFHNNGAPLPNNDTGEKENYKNLKSQCFFHSGDAVARGEYYIEPDIANKMYDEAMTLKQRLLHERKAIKRDRPDEEGKLAVVKKSEMKNYLNGESPDLMDAFMMLEWFYFDVNDTSKGLAVSRNWDDNDFQLEEFLKSIR